MTPKWPPPTVRLPARTTVGSDFVSRLAILYGASTGSTSSTPGPLSKAPPLVAARSSPIAAMTVRSVPRSTVRFQAHGFDLLDHVLDVLFRGVTPHDNDHGLGSVKVGDWFAVRLVAEATSPSGVSWARPNKKPPRTKDWVSGVAGLFVVG